MTRRLTGPAAGSVPAWAGDPGHDDAARVWHRDNQRHLALAAAAVTARLDARPADADEPARAAALLAEEVLRTTGRPVALDELTMLFGLTGFERDVLTGAAAGEIGLPAATGPVTFARALAVAARPALERPAARRAAARLAAARPARPAPRRRARRPLAGAALGRRARAARPARRPHRRRAAQRPRRDRRTDLRAAPHPPARRRRARGAVHARAPRSSRCCSSARTG